MRVLSCASPYIYRNREGFLLLDCTSNQLYLYWSRMFELTRAMSSCPINHILILIQTSRARTRRAGSQSQITTRPLTTQANYQPFACVMSSCGGMRTYVRVSKSAKANGMVINYYYCCCSRTRSTSVLRKNTSEYRIAYLQAKR